MVPIITVIGIFLVLFGFQILVQRVTLDNNRVLRPNYIGTTYVFPAIVSVVGIIIAVLGIRSPEMSQDVTMYTRVALVTVIAIFFGLNIGFETGFAPLFGGRAESTAEFWGKTMSDFLRSFGSAFAGVVTERPWSTNALTQDLAEEIREKTQFKDQQIFGNWETLQPVGTFRNGLFQKEVPISPTSMVPIRAMMNLNCRFFHLHCQDQNGFAVFGGVTENLKFPATNIFTATEVFEEFRRGINDMPPASGSNVVANRDPIIMYVTLNNMTSQAETNFVTEFNRILGSRKLPVTINSGDFRNTTMTPNNFGDTVIVIFDKRPQTSTLQSLASGYSGEWSNMESSTKLKFIRTEEELDELANSVVQTGSTKPVGNDIFTALAPETTGGTIPISRIQRAMELGVNVQCLPLYQEGLGDIWKGRIQGMRGEGPSGQQYVEAMRPFESAGAQKNYILRKGNFANCGYILKPEIVRNPPGFANRTLQPREVVSE